MKQRIAIPIAGDMLSTHFGHCEKFAIIDANDGQITATRHLYPPQHQPGIYPAFLAAQGVNTVITGGMGQRALSLFAQHNIKVCTGVSQGEPESLARAYLNDSLTSGQNLCDH